MGWSNSAWGGCGWSNPVVGGGSGGNAVWTQTDGATASKGFTSGPFTFTVNFGTQNGYPVIAIEWDAAAAPTAVTIGGNSATLLKSSTAGSKLQVWMWTGGTLTGNQTVVISVGSTDVIGFTAGNVTTATPTPSATNTLGTYTGHADPQSMDSATSIPSSGVGVVFFGCVSSTNQTPTWDGSTTGDANWYQTALGNTLEIGSGHRATAGSWTPGVSGSSSFGFSTLTLVVITWGP